jgi:hypothetical protein
VLPADGVPEGQFLQVEAGQRERQPPVRLLQGPRRPAHRRRLGEQAGVDRQLHRALRVVGGDLHVGEVGHDQRAVGRRRALLQRLAGRGDLGVDGRGVVLHQPLTGGDRVLPGRPQRFGAGGERGGGVVEEAGEGVGAVAVGRAEQPPEDFLEAVLLGIGGAADRTGGHGSSSPRRRGPPGKKVCR